MNLLKKIKKILLFASKKKEEDEKFWKEIEEDERRYYEGIASRDWSHLSGADLNIRFYFSREIPEEKEEEILSPNTMDYQKIKKEGINYYQIGEDNYQIKKLNKGFKIIFNAEIKYPKAKKIMDEIRMNIIQGTLQKLNVVLINSEGISYPLY